MTNKLPTVAEFFAQYAGAGEHILDNIYVLVRGGFKLKVDNIQNSGKIISPINPHPDFLAVLDDAGNVIAGEAV